RLPDDLDRRLGLVNMEEVEREPSSLQRVGDRFHDPGAVEDVVGDDEYPLRPEPPGDVGNLGDGAAAEEQAAGGLEGPGSHQRSEVRGQRSETRRGLLAAA